MINTIYTASTGLDSFSNGLSVISDNVSNLNTVGFKQNRAVFADLGENKDQSQGNGVDVAGVYRQFAQGDIRTSTESLDVAIDGAGFLVLDADGQTVLTRSGQMQIDATGTLVSRESTGKVMGLVGGALSEINITAFRTNPAKATTRIEIVGALNESSSQTGARSVEVTVYDATGSKRVLKIEFSKEIFPKTWAYKVTENGIPVFDDTLKVGPDNPPGGMDVDFSIYSSSGVEQRLTLDLSRITDSGEGTVQVGKVDGYGEGAINRLVFDENGVLKASYSNGQTQDIATLALANTFQLERLQTLGKNMFSIDGLSDLRFSTAGKEGLGLIRAQSLEASNVEITSQFSELIVMQRAYQASSQVITTTNEMLAVLFDLKGRR